jgi:hypothetical protein
VGVIVGFIERDGAGVGKKVDDGRKIVGQRVGRRVGNEVGDRETGRSDGRRDGELLGYPVGRAVGTPEERQVGSSVVG